MGIVCAKEKKSNLNVPLLIFSGPSGVGKGSLLNRLMENYSDILEMSVSWTTREPRKGEEDGKSYFFKTMEEFNKEEEKCGFIEVSENYGNKYGTNKSVLNGIMKKGKVCLLEVDIEAGKKIHDLNPNSHFIFLNVKNIDCLKERMEKRGTEKKEQIERRFEKGKREIEEMKKSGFYKEIYNEDFDECYRNIVDLLKKLYPNQAWKKNDKFNLA